MKVIKGLFNLIILLAIIGVALLGAAWVWLNKEVAKPGPATHEVIFNIAPGEGLAGIASDLEEQGLIRSAMPLRLQAKLDGTEIAIKAGEYAIPAHASIRDILDQLVEGKVLSYKITLPEGRTTAQLLKVIAADETLTGEMPQTDPPEGSLLPDTYLYARGTTRKDLIERMQRAQEELLARLWPARQKDLPIKTPQEAIILASIVEKETARADERPQIAALFTTRLKKGMRLQSDPTIIYGISKGEPLRNKRGQRRTLYRSEIDRKTDWNTYQIDGLPKTPICNPGRDAIAAVLDPPETEYLFFVADGKGGHLFARTNAEHEANVRAYRRYEREEIARERNGGG